MTTTKAVKETYTITADKDFDWLTLGTVNDLLKKAGLKARFETQSQNIDFEGMPDGQRLTLKVWHFDFEND